MPYINKEDRVRAERYPHTAGELNYAITKLLLWYVDGKPAYQTFNDIMGALEGAKMEFYRRMVAPYEDGKIKDNGDVFTAK